MKVRVHEVLSWLPAKLANAELLGERVNSIEVSRPGDLKGSRSDQISFFFSKEFQGELLEAQPGILVTGTPFVPHLLKSGLPLLKTCALIEVADPYHAMAVVTEKFAPALSTVAFLPHAGGEHPKTSIHPTAIVPADAVIGEGCNIGPHVVLESGVKLAPRVRLGANVTLGAGVEIGEDSVLFPGVHLYEKVRLGKRARIHANAVLGADGFGYAPTVVNGQVENHQKIYHFGSVQIGDDVEIGALACVDRGTFSDTLIGDRVKIDNDVHVGHNCVVGRGTVICGKAGLAGGTIVGEFVYVGGAAGLGNKARIGDRAKIGALTIIAKDVPPGAVMLGNPAREFNEHFKAHALLNRLLKDRKKKSGQ